MMRLTEGDNNPHQLPTFKSILITGGTGTFGKAFLERLLRNCPNYERIVIYSRDELKQSELAELYPIASYPQLRFFLGDVRDHTRFADACKGIDVIVHAAALKQVPAAEYNPFEFIQTNIIGAQNVVKAALAQRVKVVVALSTDKAVEPINLYGATKLCSDKLFIAGNNISGHDGTTFSIVRYGNVMGSRGSIIPVLLRQRSEGLFRLTHPEMTRFNISVKEGVDCVIEAINTSMGGEIFVPKMPSYRLVDLTAAIDPNIDIEFTGIRPGEKLHETLVTSHDSKNLIEYKDGYLIVSPTNRYTMTHYMEKFGGKIINGDFSYTSGNNPAFLTIAQLSALISKIT